MTQPFPDGIINIKKKLIHDLTPCGTADRFMRTLNMIPASLEVEEMEHLASHARINGTRPIDGALRDLSGLAGEVVGRCILENQGMVADEQTIASYQKVARASCQAVVAHLIELNLIHLGGQP